MVPTPSRFQCIGDDLRGYFVEPKYPDARVWIVPGTYPDDPATHPNAGALWLQGDACKYWHPARKGFGFG